jgi:hypothetical protein
LDGVDCHLGLLEAAKVEPHGGGGGWMRQRCSKEA